MNIALKKLGEAVDDTAAKASAKMMTKDQVVDLISNSLESLRNAKSFFNGVANISTQLKAFVDKNIKNTQMKSMVVCNAITAGLTGLAKRDMNDNFLGAFQTTTTSLMTIMEEISANITKLFSDKTVTIYNTKISQVAIYGMISNADTFGRFMQNYISCFMADKSKGISRPAPYVIKELEADAPAVVEIINRTLNNKLSKNFVASILKYRNSGNDSNVVGSDNKSSVMLTKINTEVTEADIVSGTRGLANIFKIIGDWFVDREDRKLRKLRLERDLSLARVNLLQLELNGLDENSEEYKRQVKIIENYIKSIDRLNQEIAKLENS